MVMMIPGPNTLDLKGELHRLGIGCYKWRWGAVSSEDILQFNSVDGHSHGTYAISLFRNFTFYSIFEKR